MLLHEIISANEVSDQSILIEKILPYKKSLQVIFPDAILMVTDVFNAAQYGKIVSSSDFSDAVEEYVNTIPDLTEEEKEEQIELINFQSIPLCKL
jgi:hypothetical protein